MSCLISVILKALLGMGIGNDQCCYTLQWMIVVTLSIYNVFVHIK